MEEEKINKLYELIDNIPVTADNVEIIKEIKNDLARKRLYICLEKNRNVRTKKREKCDERKNNKNNKSNKTNFQTRKGRRYDRYVPKGVNE